MTLVNSYLGIKMIDIESYLTGGDLRSTGNVQALLPLIQTQADFDALFAYMLVTDRLLVMRAADAVEKITRDTPHYLDSHSPELLNFFTSARDIELQWHIALLASRLELDTDSLTFVWERLSEWALTTGGSRIVRVNALQSLHDLTEKHPEYQSSCADIFQTVQQENIPSINARLRRLCPGI